MRESKRRHTSYRLSDKRHDLSNLLNKMITDSNELNLRESFNPLEPDQKSFKWMNNENMLSIQCLTNLVKMIEKDILVVGLILPRALLSQCCKLLSGKIQTNFSNNNIDCIILNHSIFSNIHTLILMMEDDELDKKTDHLENIIFNLSFILITTDAFAIKRAARWGVQENIFNKSSSLFVVKQENTILNEQLVQNLQNLFWSFQAINANQLNKKLNRAPKQHFLKPNRQAYQQFNEQEQETLQFTTKICETAKISLKRNWKISKGLMCFPVLYLFNFWLKQENKNSKDIIEQSLINYCQSLEEQFNKHLQNFSLPIDQLKLRNSISRQKRNILLNARKHLSMFQNLFVSFELASKFIVTLTKSFNDKEKEIYQSNNSIANKFNQNLLEKLYEQIINCKFEEQNRSQRNIIEYEADFQKLLDVYGSQSVRATSQLKTFNDFLIKKKYEYAENLTKQLRNIKKKYPNEKEELKDRLQIQTGVLDTLEMELKQLEQKRRKIDAENNLLKSSISETHKKRIAGDLHSQILSSSKKKYQDNSDKISMKISSKPLKTYRSQIKKESKCCCIIC